MGSAGTGAPLVTLAGVEKTYHSGRVPFRALRGIDLPVLAGEMVAIAGPAGSGKTTIVNLIAGIDRPSAGTVTVHGTRLDPLGKEQLAIWRRANIGMGDFLLLGDIARNGTRPFKVFPIGIAADDIAVIAGHRLPEKAGGFQMTRLAGELVQPRQSDQFRNLSIGVDMGQTVLAAAQGLQDFAVINSLGQDSQRRLPVRP